MVDKLIAPFLLLIIRRCWRLVNNFLDFSKKMLTFGLQGGIM
nr:MAG TPA: hypothetical protein [Caudoviricetes sp.]